jgi:polysaccharide pyruvyl transferase WcaK-like protein
MAMAKLVLPRVILGNRGDIASRWGIINALHRSGLEDVSIFCDSLENIPPVPYPTFPYGKLRNLIFTREGSKAIKGANIVLWAAGLDMQDDSSLLKLIYLWMLFWIFRFLGLRIWCFLQGAGPIETRAGRKIARGVLKKVDRFVARDTGSLKLMGEIYPDGNYSCAYDGVFLRGLETDPELVKSGKFRPVFANRPNLLIGFNVRMWFHFNSSLLPYEFNRQAYEKRARESMDELVETSGEAIAQLRERFDARVVLLSGYQPGVVPWEDDLPWLAQIKNECADDSEVVLIDAPMSMPAYFTLMSSLDLMIGMRLHTVLTAIRFGVPSINLSYTLKGSSILSDLGLGDCALGLVDFMRSPKALMEKVAGMVSDMAGNRERVASAAATAIEENERALRYLFK